MIFQTATWQVDIPVPWQAVDLEYCVEITQPESVGALHLSSYWDSEGMIEGAEVRNQFESDCPIGTVIRTAICGDYAGYWAEYTDSMASTYWREWILYCRQSWLFVSYTCEHGEEKLETSAAAGLLQSL